MNPAPRPIFLTAEWRHLVMASYAVDPAALAALTPPGTELDFTADGRTFISLVGFLFQNTRLAGGRVRVPFHADFPEVNLRFYVRRRGPDGAWRRGTVFVKEIVSLLAVAAVARICYGEKYVCCPLRWERSGGDAARGPDALTFRWKTHGEWHSLAASANADDAGWQPIAPGSMPEWITEHYYGYSARHGVLGWLRPPRTTEYAVEHPRWRVRPAASFEAHLPAATRLYGPAFADVMRAPPDNVLIAEGSPVLIRRGVRLASAG